MSDQTKAEQQHREQGYREYTIGNAALHTIAASGGELVIKRSSAFTITDTEDTDWLGGLSIRDVEAEA